jgi:hypothetical protein
LRQRVVVDPAGDVEERVAGGGEPVDLVRGGHERDVIFVRDVERGIVEAGEEPVEGEGYDRGSAGHCRNGVEQGLRVELLRRIAVAAMAAPAGREGRGRDGGHERTEDAAHAPRVHHHVR